MANLSYTDPSTQMIKLRLADGSPLAVSLSDLDAFMQYNLNICINLASQIGASMVLLVVLLLLTKPDKRRAPIFVTNVLSLSLNVIRNVLQCLYYTGAFSRIYTYFSGDEYDVPRKAYAASIAGAIMPVLLLVCVECSLLLQLQVVCCTLPRLYRQVVYTVSLLMAGLAIAFRLALAIENCRIIIHFSYNTILKKLADASNITASISICFFCAAFVAKLGFALNQRRKLGLGQFGPMQIIFIMGCQTLFIPAVFSILPYIVQTPAISSLELTMVAIFLPLSSLWASASVGNRTSSPVAMQFQQKPSSTSSFGSSGPLVNGKILHGPLSPTNTTRTDMSNTTLTNSPRKHQQDIMYRDLEAQELDGAHIH